MTKTVFHRITKNIEGVALAVVTIWGSSGAFIFQTRM